MPKNHKPKGGRPARNFEPRYAKKTPFHDRHAPRPAAGRGESSDRNPRADSSFESREPRSASYDRRPGSRSPGHRGHRATESDAGAGAPKRRWTAQERAGRDEARTIRNRAESGRGDAPRSRDERPRFDRDDRARRDDRAPYGRDDRARRDDRPRFDRDDRPRRDDRAPYGRDDRARTGRDERPRYDRDDRARRDERPRFDRDARQGAGRDDRRPDARRDDRPRFDRDDRARRDDRPRYDTPRYDTPRYGRDDRARTGRDERPRYDRDDRARTGRDDRRSDDRRSEGRRPEERRDERPRFDRDARQGAGRDDRRSDDRRSETRRDDRPRFERNDRPRTDRPRTDRPRVDRDERPRRDDRAGSDRFGARRDDRTREDRTRGRDDRRAAQSRPSRDDWTRTPATKPVQAPDVVHERLEAQAVQAAEVQGVTFADLGIGSNITEVLVGMGAETPFPIQAASIPAALEGRDVLARGRTGSGKTIAFGAPLVESVLRSQAGTKREFGRAPKAIILAPTRELALQIDRTIQPIARSVGLFTTQIYGGVPQARQVGALKKGVDIVIGTPGRIEDLIQQGKLDLSGARIAVLDEADHMCELGFVEPVQRILRRTGSALPAGERSQKLLFSATLDREVAALVDEFLVDPAVFEVAGETQDSGTIDHRVLVIDHRDKTDILISLVDREGKTLVFARTRAYAETLAETFDDAGIPAVSLHGDLNQGKRTRNLARLTSGRVQVLVATDVAARGIHVDDIDLVVQADPPDEYKTYMHRSGRTGRAGREGRVVTLITRQRSRRMGELLDRAEIDAPFQEARPGDDLIDELAGRVTLADLTS